MIKSILITTDGSPLAELALDNGIALAKSLAAKVTVLIVEPVFPHFMIDVGFVKSAEFDIGVKALSKKTLESAAARAAAAGVACETLAVSSDNVHQAIIDIASSKRCDLIVMASHGRGGASAVVLGSQTLKVLTHSKIPVLVYR